MKRKLTLTFTFLSFALFCAAQPLTLEAYRELTLKNNGGLQQAEYEKLAAEQTAKYAFTKYFPTVSAIGAVVSTDFVPGTSRAVSTLPNIFGLPSMVNDSHGYGLSALMATQVLFAGGRIYNGNQLAQTGSNAAKQRFIMKRDEVFLEGEKKFRRLIVLDKKKQTLTAYGNMVDALYRQVSQAKEMGLVTRTDVLRVKLKQAEIASLMSSLEKGITLARKDFNIYASLPADAQSEIAAEEEEITQPKYDLDDIPYRLTLRPEYKLLEDNLKAAKLERRIKTGENMPSLSVGAAIDRVDFHSTGNTYQNSIGFAALSVPISDWWGGAHSIKEQRLKQRAAQTKLDETADYLMLDMESKYKDFQQAYERVEVARLGVEEAKANRSEIEDGYNNGTEKLADLLEAMALEQQSQDKLAEETAAYFTSKTAFETAIAVAR